MSADFHSRMLREFNEKAALEAARTYAFAFIDRALERRV